MQFVKTIRLYVFLLLRDIMVKMTNMFHLWLSMDLEPNNTVLMSCRRNLELIVHYKKALKHEDCKYLLYGKSPIFISFCNMDKRKQFEAYFDKW